MNKAIITVVGQDTVGIIARVCTYLSDHKVNVLDISQTIIDGFFNIESKLATAFVGKKARALAKGACTFRATASRGFAEVRAFSMRRSRLGPPQIHHFGDVYL